MPDLEHPEKPVLASEHGYQSSELLHGQQEHVVDAATREEVVLVLAFEVVVVNVFTAHRQVVAAHAPAGEDG